MSSGRCTKDRAIQSTVTPSKPSSRPPGQRANGKAAAERLFHVWGHKATGFAKDRMGFLSGPGHHSKEAVIKALRVRRSGGGGA